MNFIPLEYYSLLFFQLLLLIVAFTYLNSLQTELTNSRSLQFTNYFGRFVVLVVILYLGLRPISFAFGDMGVYNIEFKKYVAGASFDARKDLLFEGMKYFFAKYLTAKSFFFTCAFFYVYLLYLATKKMFKDYWFYAFLMLIVAFTFWAYGSNGIRNGLATSVFVYALSRDKKYAVYILLLISYFIHKGMFIPIFGFIVASNFSNIKWYLFAWFSAIPLALFFGGFWHSFFLGLGMGEDKLDTYLGSFDQVNAGVELVVGFRWDFLIYSFSGVFAGWYFIIKKGFNDVFYTKLFNIYLMANALWILVIRANYSNRFAFLSWFLLGLVILYPLLKSRIVTNQHAVIVRIILVFFAFCYLMNVILLK